MFFSFEGIDGSGKTTQARLLAEALRTRGYEVTEVREPGGTHLGEAVRALLLDPNREIDERAELLLFSAARAQLVTEVIRPALDSGAIVIADRFSDSSTAYQGGGRGVASEPILMVLHEFATKGTTPDRTFLVDVPLDVASSRRDARELDRLEKSGRAFYSRVRDAYQTLTALDRVISVDGTQPVAHLHAQIQDVALSLLRSQKVRTSS